MIHDPSSLIASMIAGTAAIIVLFFLPALIELKIPKDAGPRLIDDNILKPRINTLKLPITDIEEEQKFTYQPTLKIADSCYTIPNLEG